MKRIHFKKQTLNLSEAETLLKQLKLVSKDNFKESVKKVNMFTVRESFIDGEEDDYAVGNDDAGGGVPFDDEEDFGNVPEREDIVIRQKYKGAVGRSSFEVGENNNHPEAKWGEFDNLEDALTCVRDRAKADNDNPRLWLQMKGSDYEPIDYEGKSLNESHEEDNDFENENENDEYDDRNNEPEEGDYMISDARGSGYFVSIVNGGSRSLRADASDWDQALALIKADMEKENFFPGVWYINDHGNVDIVNMNESTKKIEGVSADDLKSMISKHNKEHGTEFSLSGAYGKQELWAKTSKGDNRIEVGSKEDLKKAFNKEKFKDKYVVNEIKENTSIPKKGDKVEHPRFGSGVVTNVDSSSYSTPMISAKYDKGEITKPMSELKLGEASKKKSIDIGDGYYVTRMGKDTNGNKCVWVAKGSNSAKKVQTNGNAPTVHSNAKSVDWFNGKDKEVTKGIKELKNYLKGDFDAKVEEAVKAIKLSGIPVIKLSSKHTTWWEQYDLSETQIKSAMKLLREDSKSFTAEGLYPSYIEAALWSSLDISGEEDGNDDNLDANYSIDDMSAEAKQQALSDLTAFIAKAGDLLTALDPEQVAHDFWLTRAHHGAGFWDGDYIEEVGKALTDITHQFKEVDIYPGDDGQLYFGGWEALSEAKDKKKTLNPEPNLPVRTSTVTDNLEKIASKSKSLDDFLKKVYKPEEYENLPRSKKDALLQQHKREVEAGGFTNITPNKTKSGKEEAYLEKDKVAEKAGKLNIDDQREDLVAEFLDNPKSGINTLLSKWEDSVEEMGEKGAINKIKPTLTKLLKAWALKSYEDDYKADGYSLKDVYPDSIYSRAETQIISHLKGGMSIKESDESCLSDEEILALAKRLNDDGHSPEDIQVSMAGEDNDDLMDLLKSDYGVEINDTQDLVRLEVAFETLVGGESRPSKSEFKLPVGEATENMGMLRYKVTITNKDDGKDHAKVFEAMSEVDATERAVDYFAKELKTNNLELKRVVVVVIGTRQVEVNERTNKFIK